MLEGLLQGIVEEPQDDSRWLVLADWLEEHDDPRRAELLRLHRRLIATCCEPEGHPERAAWQGRIVELLGQGVRPCVPQRTISLGEGVAMTFYFIPPGRFLIGSPPDEEGRGQDEVRHRVTLTNGFWLGVTPVTQAQWTAVTGGNPSWFMGDDLPVERVSWHDCVAYCQRLGEKFRLPTEAQWEYACRAGTTTAYHTGSDQTALGRAGWYYENNDTGTRTEPVGRKQSNAWGLYDLHGNVWEWCQDRYGVYRSADATDPRGPDGGTGRVIRGGSRHVQARRCRSAERFQVKLRASDGHLGWRVVLSPG